MNSMTPAGSTGAGQHTGFLPAAYTVNADDVLNVTVWVSDSTGEVLQPLGTPRGSFVWAQFENLTQGWSSRNGFPAASNAMPFSGCNRALWVMEYSGPSQPIFNRAYMSDNFVIDTDGREYVPFRQGQTMEKYIMVAAGNPDPLVAPFWDGQNIVFTQEA